LLEWLDNAKGLMYKCWWMRPRWSRAIFSCDCH